jgi:hypothetical protein
MMMDGQIIGGEGVKFQLGAIKIKKMTKEERKKWDLVDWTKVPFIQSWGGKP